MRTAVLIAATAAALTLSACGRTEDAPAVATTEAEEASGTAVDTAGTAAPDGVVAPGAQAGDAPRP